MIALLLGGGFLIVAGVLYVAKRTEDSKNETLVEVNEEISAVEREIEVARKRQSLDDKKVVLAKNNKS